MAGYSASYLALSIVRIGEIYEPMMYVHVSLEQVVISAHYLIVMHMIRLGLS